MRGQRYTSIISILGGLTITTKSDIMESLKKITGLDHYLQFKTPISFILAGASFSGKTTFLAELIKNKSKMFNPEPVEIMFVYTAWQDIYDQLEKTVPGIVFINRIPSKQEIDKFTADCKPRLLCLDDKMTQLSSCPDITEYFTVYTHHRNLSCILLLQNIYYQGAKCLRDISLNVQGMFLFKNIRSPQQIDILATQMFPRKRAFFLDAYEKACAKPFGYLFVDLNPRNTAIYQLRTDILPGQNTIIFLPSSA